MSNSHWYHFFLHDAFGVLRSKINFFLGARYALWSLRGGGGGHVSLLPPLGSGTGKSHRKEVSDTEKDLVTTENFVTEKGIFSQNVFEEKYFNK